jgi:hypothetical protein
MSPIAPLSSLVFIDSTVADYQSLLEGLTAGTEAIVLDPAEDGVEQITAALASRTGIESVHIVSHGSAGSLQLGAVTLNGASIDRYASSLQQWQGALSETANILLYGCNVAIDAQGQAFVQELSQLTQADLAASTNLTGCRDLGGDWDLEFTTGNIQSVDPFRAGVKESYAHTLANFVVTNSNDSGAGSLRQAILDANASAGADLIVFRDVPLITLTSGELTITGDVTIHGNNFLATTISGNNASRVFNITGGNVTLSSLTVRNGQSTVGGGISQSGGTTRIKNSVITSNNSSTIGGGIALTGSSTSMTIEGSTITDNVGGANGGGGVYAGTGSTLLLLNSTVSNNRATNAGFGGGGLLTEGAVTIANSTISGNTITGDGGGIFSVGALTITNSTITNNTADFDNNNSGTGGGIFRVDGTVTVRNTIVAGNFDTPGNAGAGSTARDLSGTFVDGGNNLIGSADGSTGFTVGTRVGTNAAPINPQLGVLANNGGNTQTHALNAGSLAIDAGSNANQPLDILDFDGDGNTTETIPIDQEGKTRAAGTVDIGAFESGTTPSPNDNFANRFFIPNGTLAFTVAGSNKNAVIESGDLTNRNTIWWSWTAPMAGTYRVNTIGSTVDDTFLYVYTGTAINSLTLINSNDDGSGVQSVLSFSAIAGTTYHFAAASFSSVPSLQGGLLINTRPEFNSSPVLSDTVVAFNAINGGTGAPVNGSVAGTLVSQLVDLVGGGGQNNVTDADSGAVTGIAITAADTINGTWFYSTNNGGTWTSLGSVSNTSARLLAADASTRLYFQPNVSYSGTLTNAITFRAWDQTNSLVNGSTADTASNGGVTAFSAATDTASIVVNPINFVVTNTNDSGAGSLRQAILDANALVGVTVPSQITFAIPGAGVKKIDLLSPLPFITRPVTIDGYSQSGATANTLTTGSNANLLIEINGNRPTVLVNFGFRLEAGSDGSTIKGLILNGFDQAPITIAGGTNQKIQGNFIGTNAAGTGSPAAANTAGILIIGGAALIGGTLPSDRNIISGSSGRGIRILAGAGGNQIINNYIGTNAAGTAAIANSSFGIEVNMPNTIIRNNLVSGNGSDGIYVTTIGNTVAGNLIGTSANGTAALANNGSGVSVNSSDNIIGGTTAIDSNNIQYNAGNGVVVNSGTGNSIRGNAIANNAGLGIDLGNNGVTPNDSNDADAGANNLQNFVVLTAATLGATSTTITGTLNSTNGTFTVELFANDTPEGSLHGEGQTYLGTTTVTTTANNGNFTFNVPNALNGKWITATVTDTLNSTSEFSAAIATALPNVAPDLNNAGAPTLTTINEDVLAAANTGTKVSDLISGLITDGNGDPKAIAITNVDRTNGSWEYSTNGGTTWSTITTTNQTNATVLGATSFYSANLGTAPSAQSWLSYTALNVSGVPTAVPNTESTSTSGALVSTTANQSIYAGYSNYNTSNALVNANSPTLNNTQGYSLSFDLQVLADSNTNPNRAGFSVLIVSQDTTKAIELAFQRTSSTTGNIFAQSSGFIAAEAIAYNTNQKTDYRVEVLGNDYKLFANNTQILTGSLRNYGGFVPPANFPFNPYTKSNLVFLGDNTTSARGMFNLTQVAVQTDTRIRYVPNANTNGNATIDFRAWDTTNGLASGAIDDTSLHGGNTAYSAVSETATITVNAVNDAPSFTNLGNQSVAGGTNTAQTVTGWASGVNFGATNESTQTVSDYLVSVTSGAALFTTAPDVSNTGELTYTPNGTSGTATVEVRLKDDGGIANGGQDTSAVSTFTITIAPPTVAFSTATQSGSEGGSLTVTVSLSNPSSQAITVPLTITGTADSSDYSGIPTSVTIAANSTSANFTVALTNDTTTEVAETIAIALGTPTNATVGTITTQTITIGVSDNTPIATADTATVNEDTTTATAISVLGNDSFAPDTDEILSITSVGATSNGGTAVISGTNINYTPAANFSGTETFDYTLSDGTGGTATNTVTVTVNAINDAPSFTNLGNQSVAGGTNTAQTVTGWASGVNYGAPNESTQTVSDYLVTVTSGAALFTTAPDVSNTGELTYTPSGTSGTATVEVRLKDDGGIANGGQDTSAVSTFTITIAPPTVNFSTATQSGSEGGSLTVTVNLSNPSSQAITVPLTITGTANSTDYSGIPASITIAANSTSANFTVALTNDTTTEVAETIAINMGTPTNATAGTIATQTITIGTSDNTPIATADTATVNEDTTTATAISVLGNDSFAPDTDEVLSIASVGATSNGGTAVISGTNINYTPAANFSGTETFDYTISDGTGGTATNTVTVTVNAINDIPSFTNLGNQSVAGGTNTAQTVTGWVSGVNFGAPNESTQTVSDYLVTVISGAALFTTAPDVSNTGELTYTPSGTSGTATVEVRLKDDGGTANGGQDTSTVSTFTITIAPPTVSFSTATQSGAEGGDLTVTINLSNPSSQAITVPLTITGTATDGTDYSGIPASVTIAANSTSAQFTVPLTNDTTAEVAETIAITLGTLTNATAGTITTQTITIGANDNNPTATADTAIVNEDSPTTTIDVLTNDSFAPDTGEVLSITSVTTPNRSGTAVINGTNISYTPAADFNGTETFDYTISDGTGGTATATVTVTVNAANDNPTAIADTAIVAEDTTTAISINVLTNDLMTPDTGEVLSIASVGTTSNGGTAVVNGTGTAINYTPAANFSGTETFTYTISDGNSGTSTATVTVTVTPINDPPTIAGIPTTTIDEDSPYSFTPTAVDVDTTDTLTFSITNKPTWADFDPATGKLSGTPTNAAVGTTTGIVISVTDSATPTAGTAALAAFDLTVTNVNDAPTVTNAIADRTTNEDTPFTFIVPANTFTDPDVGDTLTYSVTQANNTPLPTWLTFNPTTRTFSGTPRNANVGDLELKLKVTDTSGATAEDTFMLKVINVNQPPTLGTPIAPAGTGTGGIQATAEQPFTLQVPPGAFIDSDPGDTFTLSATQENNAPLPTWLKFDPKTGLFSGTPTFESVGNLSLKVTATDAIGSTTSQLVRVTIANPTGITGIATPAIDFTGGIKGVTLKATKGKTLLGTRGSDILRGTPGRDRINSGKKKDSNGKDKVYGLNGNDILTSGGGSDTVEGGRGNDLIKTGTGRDLLLGNDGNDRLFGEKGSDILIGGNGADTLVGGKGRDMFGYGAVTEGKDTIVDFAPASDVIDLRSLFSQPQFAGATPYVRYLKYVQLAQVGSGTEVRIDTDGSGIGTTFTTLATLNNTKVNAIGARNFVIS